MKNDEVCISTFLVGEWTNVMVKKHFDGKSLFRTEMLVSPSLSRWSLFRCAVEHAEKSGDDDVIVVCFNEHNFTNNFDGRLFLDVIVEASKRGAQLLIGGCQKVENMVPVTSSLFWVDVTSGASFYVVYRSVYRKILSITIDGGDADLDEIISQYIPNKFLVCPIISDSSMQDSASSDVNSAQETMNIYKTIIAKYNLLS